MPKFDKWMFRIFLTIATIFLVTSTLILTTLALTWDDSRNKLIIRLSFGSIVVVLIIALMIRKLFKLQEELLDLGK